MINSGTLFIGNDEINCFGTGLPILMCKDVYQYPHFMYNNYIRTLQMFEINPKSEKNCKTLSRIFVFLLRL